MSKLERKGRKRKAPRVFLPASPEQELHTIEQLCDRERAFRIGGVRWMVFNRDSNGLEKSGALIRVGRRVLIDRPKFLAWLMAQQHRERAA